MAPHRHKAGYLREEILDGLSNEGLARVIRQASEKLRERGAGPLRKQTIAGEYDDVLAETYCATPDGADLALALAEHGIPRNDNLPPPGMAS